MNFSTVHVICDDVIFHPNPNTGIYSNNTEHIHRQLNNIDPFKHVMTERYIKCSFIYYFANDSNSENNGT